MKKRFLLPLLVALALPTAVNAETWALMVMEYKSNSNKPGVFEVIPNITFSTGEACAEIGKRFAKRNEKWWSYHCFKGQ